MYDWLCEYRRPEPTETSEHAGEYHGMAHQIQKNLIGIVHEALIFLQENADIVKSPELRKYENELSRNSRDVWKLINGFAFNSGMSEELRSVERIMEKIRHNVAFHYPHSRKSLVRGFRHHFYQEGFIKSDAFKVAYFSCQRTEPMATRFYYADAALGGYLAEQLSSSGEPPEVVFKKIFKFSTYIGRSILDLLTVYHSTKINR